MDLARRAMKLYELFRFFRYLLSLHTCQCHKVQPLLGLDSSKYNLLHYRRQIHVSRRELVAVEMTFEYESRESGEGARMMEIQASSQERNSESAFARHLRVGGGESMAVAREVKKSAIQ